MRRADLEQAQMAQRARERAAQLQQNWAAKMMENQRMTEQNQLVAQNRADNLSLEGQRNLTTASHYRALENSAMSGQKQAAELAAATQLGLNTRAAAVQKGLNDRAGNKPNPFDLSQFGSENTALRQNMAAQGKLDLSQASDRDKLVELQVQQYDIQSQIDGLRAVNPGINLGGVGMGSPSNIATAPSSNVQRNAFYPDEVSPTGSPQLAPPLPLTNSPAAGTVEKIIVIKDGKKFRLPASQLDEAVKSGYQLFQ